MAMDSWRPSFSEFRREVRFDGPQMLFTAQLDNLFNAVALGDTGCSSYSIISEKYVRRHQLKRVEIQPRRIAGYDGGAGDITQVAQFALRVGNNWQARIYAYVVPHLEGEDLILGSPWMRHQGAIVDASNGKQGDVLRFPDSSYVPALHNEPKLQVKQINAAAFSVWKRRERSDRTVQVFAASMADIEKALKVKSYSDPREKLPRHYRRWLQLFDRKHADRLPPHRPGIDHRIEIAENDANGNPKQPPYGPLFSMSREELLVLRKTLQELLDKNFIRISNSPAAAPVLFARKPGGGLRFCTDYRALNAISRKDRYPLPLINETLERIGRARWFTKLDVIAAFHRIRIEKGQEWMTAFRTRFGLFEWLVTPFGLANAPSTFQRYVNWVLRDMLDEYASAYLDDILIFSSGSREDHRRKVANVLQRLQDAGLQLDIDKCEFEVQKTKYLGFIVEVGKGVQMDPEKLDAIKSWETPTSVRGVRAFIGFANFYRRFIRNFADVAAPLTALTQKDRDFEWTAAAEDAFQRLKTAFTTAPILMQFDPDRRTRVETDSSGWATGGVLSQYDDNGVLRPCAFFSRKNSPAECNYPIHDKELLAIINCLKQWEAELMAVRQFSIITDHKNLRYFSTIRRLNERQMRWSDILSAFNFELCYRPGKQALVPDALSRREQDMPADGSDERLRNREKQLFRQEDFIADANGNSRIRVTAIRHVVAPVTNQAEEPPTEDETTGGIPLEEQWAIAEGRDQILQAAREAVREGLPRFPKELQLQLSIGECEFDNDNRLLWRKRRWVPKDEALRTRIMQECHDSLLGGHPGHNTLYGLLARTVFWPDMATDVKRFVRNCDLCGANRVWRDRRQGLLKPLPIPDRKWRHISLDFIPQLPETTQGHKHVLVIVDRLTKGPILVPLSDLETETVARAFITFFVGYHGLPETMVSDRGGQFVNELWGTLCRMLKIKRNLSTAYHPQSDGQTERMNAVIEGFVRNYCDYAQREWHLLLPMAQLASANHDSTSTGMSAFFLDHGYHLDVLQLQEPNLPDTEPSGSMRETGQRIARKLQDALSIAQAEMAAAQQRQEHYANQRRQVAPQYRVGDKVWLDLRDIRTDRPNRKFSARSAKYTVLEQVSPYAYRLDTPEGIHPVFHVDKLRLAATDPFPSQRNDDYQPPARLVEGEPEWEVEEIRDYRARRWGRGFRREFLVKWVGYREPQWTPAHLLEDTAALDVWEQRNGDPESSRTSA